MIEVLYPVLYWAINLVSSLINIHISSVYNVYRWFENFSFFRPVLSKFRGVSLIFSHFQTFYEGWVASPSPQLSTRRTKVSLFAWSLTLGVSGLEDPTGSYATFAIALGITGTLKPPHHNKLEIPSRRLHLLITLSNCNKGSPELLIIFNLSNKGETLH